LPAMDGPCPTCRRRLRHCSLRRRAPSKHSHSVSVRERQVASSAAPLTRLTGPHVTPAHGAIGRPSPKLLPHRSISPWVPTRARLQATWSCRPPPSEMIRNAGY